MVPEELSAEEAAPLMCAGVTTFNCLRNSGARPGDVVAVIGLGGLGHLGIQFAARSGFNTVAIGRGKDKEELAKKLGASHYIDSATQDPAAELLKLGGAKVILATVTSADAMKAVIGGLDADRDAHDRRRRALVGGPCAAAAAEVTAGQRLVFGNVARFAGDAGVSACSPGCGR